MIKNKRAQERADTTSSVVEWVKWILIAIVLIFIAKAIIGGFKT